jgi:RimJ/RimL family protein N-acetyltransferase
MLTSLWMAVGHYLLGVRLFPGRSNSQFMELPRARSNPGVFIFRMSAFQARLVSRAWLFDGGMLMIHNPLFESVNLRLAAIDPDEDAKVESAWTYDLDYTRALINGSLRPLGAMELRKFHEDEQKRSSDRGSQFYFAIRLKDGDHLAGFIRFPQIFWSHSSAWLNLMIADPSILASYGREALEIALVYGFGELNLYRVETTLADDQQELIDLFEQAGFLLEIRRRQAFYRSGRYHDAFHYGLLQDEWKARIVQGVAS